MFFGLGKQEQRQYFNRFIQIKKGMEFYRIRKVSGFNNPNIYDAKEWGPVPESIATQGRFNENHQSMLYIASSPDYLCREVRLKENEEYYLARYICIEDFQVGCFLKENDLVNALMHKIAMSIASPAELTDNENALIDKYYAKIKRQPLRDLSLDMLASLYIYKLIPSLYDVTNKLGRLVLANNEYGIRYSSVYVPIEFSGGPQIITLDGVDYGNYVLTPKGYDCLELIDVEKKKCEQRNDLDLLIRTFIEVVDDEKQ